jgi:predicted nucleic-acid-binding Zn-ribbon protein
MAGEDYILVINLTYYMKCPKCGNPTLVEGEEVVPGTPMVCGRCNHGFYLTCYCDC